MNDQNIGTQIRKEERNMNNVLEFLYEACKRQPNKIALSDADSEITYRQLVCEAESVGTALVQQIGAKRLPIAVLVDRNLESICCFLGVVESGNFYVPISTEQPRERLEAIITQMQPAAIIATCDFSLLSEMGEAGIPVFEYQQLNKTVSDQALLETIRANSLDIDPLFAICTSGSTGTPKGVVKSHRSVLEFVPVFARTFGFNEDERFANQAPFDFDVSAKDIYTTLYCCASLFIIPKVCFSMPKKLATALDEREITTLIWAVSALCVVAGLKAFKHTKPRAIRKVMFSGEVMPIKHLNTWREYYPDAQFVNLYGPTESTGNCLFYIVDRDFSEGETLPLGIPFDNVEVMVLDEGKPIERGGMGEVFIRGACVALGYYRDPTRTAASFVQNPLNEVFPELVYRTGDLVRINEDGELFFAGRKDFQIKHMGHRIELEELETHMNALDGITRSCCVFDEKHGQIVAFYEGDLESTEIIQQMGKKLPKYMIPNRFERVEQIPISKNGKIDRAKLREALN